MLPDLASLKRRLVEHLSRAVEMEAMRRAPLVSQIKAYHQKEGDRYSYETHEGEVSHERFKVMRTPMTTKILPSPIEQKQEIDQKLEEAAGDIAKQQTQLLFTTLTESSKRAGTSYNARGRPFDMGMFLDVLEGLWVDFDDHGQPILPTIVLHPDQMKAIGPRLAEWEKDPALQARWNDVIARKREEWRAREGHRKLVG
jgi:hypothetical protein